MNNTIFRRLKRQQKPKQQTSFLRKVLAGGIVQRSALYGHSDLTDIRSLIQAVSSILQSYSAKVTTVMSNNIDCVLVGGRHENIDGAGLSAARAMRKPIMEEIEFFNAYGIDEDLNNLV